MPNGAVGREEFTLTIKGLGDRICAVEQVIDGPPHPGLEKRVDKFMTKIETLEEERVAQHKANTTRLNIIISILLAIAAYIAIVISIGKPLKSAVDPVKLFHTLERNPVLSYLQPKPERSTLE